jgi:hypothetical protein
VCKTLIKPGLNGVDIRVGISKEISKNIFILILPFVG